MTKKSMKLTITKTKNETSNDSLNDLSYLMKLYNLKQNKKLKRNMEANHLHEQMNKVKDEWKQVKMYQLKMIMFD